MITSNLPSPHRPTNERKNASEGLDKGNIFARKEYGAGATQSHVIRGGDGVVG